MVVAYTVTLLNVLGCLAALTVPREQETRQWLWLCTSLWLFTLARSLCGMEKRERSLQEEEVFIPQDASRQHSDHPDEAYSDSHDFFQDFTKLMATLNISYLGQ